MRIKTLTCHDVYNVGASLQAYALCTYLQSLGHEVQIIDYKPDYLVHYRLGGVSNDKYNKPFLREVYLALKLPGRILERYGKRKKAFDDFTKAYLPLTEKRYISNEDLKKDLPDADVYLAGSDQIWNCIFPNGKDPAFYLDFAPEKAIKASYAASFSTESIPKEFTSLVSTLLKNLDYVSLRESSGVTLARELGRNDAVSVLDPVFLLPETDWRNLQKPMSLSEPYLLLYDFDQSPEIGKQARKYAEERGLKVYSVFPSEWADKSFDKEGPLGFLTLIFHAEAVYSNSFHATAFSIIGHIPFAVFDRREKINTRMHDLTDMLGLPFEVLYEGNWEDVQERLNHYISDSKSFLNQVLQGKK